MLARLAILLVILVCGVCSTGQRAAAGETALAGHVFTLPDGFEITPAAGPPLVDRPITADLDELGRLYVADSSGTNASTQEQLVERPHQILRLVDADGDGAFDERTVFADHMMFPEGTMWFDGSLYVSTPPSIWKLTDTNDDGVADVREEWFQGKTLTGCANDLHGPYRGPDGWIYWCKGAFAEQTYDRPGKPPLVTRASHIFRCRADGSGLEHVMTGGMDNPVDVAFTPGGERIFTTTFLVHPGNGLRDGLIHAVYGGVYGKDHDVLAGHQRTGELLPALVHLGPAAPCGLTCYESAAFGDEYQHNLFACSFNLHKLTRHILTPAGATFQSDNSDFLVSDNLDFHPTDVIEDADGSLLVVNTGGWYKLCCPTSQLWKPDVLGGIYRVRRTSAAAIDDPRGLALDWKKPTPAELAARIADKRPAVRRRATELIAALGDAGAKAVAAVVHLSSDPQVRVSGVWALSRIDSKVARRLIRSALAEKDAIVRQAAIHAISVNRDAKATPELIRLLGKREPQVQRAAAEALGRLGGSEAVSALLEQASLEHDRVLEHSLTFALIEIADPTATRAGLASSSPWCRRAALVALDQMYGGGLDPLEVAERLESNEPIERETAAWIVLGHPEWADSLVEYLTHRLDTPDLSQADADELTRQLARFARSGSVQELLAKRAPDAAATPASRQISLAAMAAAELAQMPSVWVSALVEVMSQDDPGLAALAVSAARKMTVAEDRAPELATALSHVGGQVGNSVEVRLQAMAAVPGGLSHLEPEVFDLLRGVLDPDQDVSQRALAADVLGRSRLDQAQLSQLAGLFAEAGPLEANRLLPAYKDCEDEAVGLGLVRSLEESPALTGLRLDALALALAKFPPPVHDEARSLYARLNFNPEEQRQKLETLLGSLKEGDIRRGQAVFQNTKAACAACHKMGYVGGTTGPDLTRIGQIRTERDLLESIVFPNVSFVRSFEPTQVVTRQGMLFNGLIVSETPEQLVIATGPKEEVRIPREDIEEMQPGTVSVMPSGLDQQLTPQDLADLLAFLKAAK